VLWDRGEASVHEVRECLGRRKLAYTTVLSTMQKLEKAGWLTHDTRGRTYVYRPACSRTAARVLSLKAIIARCFRGDPLLLVENLIGETALGDDELARLRKMIDERRKELRDE
jgi:predicted transcriptional regulator